MESYIRAGKWECDIENVSYKRRLKAFRNVMASVINILVEFLSVSQYVATSHSCALTGKGGGCRQNEKIIRRKTNRTENNCSNYTKPELVHFKEEEENISDKKKKKTK